MSSSLICKSGHPTAERCAACWLQSGLLCELVCSHSGFPQLAAPRCLFLRPCRDTAVESTFPVVPCHLSSPSNALKSHFCEAMAAFAAQGNHLGKLQRTSNPGAHPEILFNGSQFSMFWASVFKGSLGNSHLPPRLSGMGRCGVEIVCTEWVKTWVMLKQGNLKKLMSPNVHIQIGISLLEMSLGTASHSPKPLTGSLCWLRGAVTISKLWSSSKSDLVLL